MDSKTVFAEAVKEYELEVLMPKFAKEGWDTFANFAFCVPDFSGKDTTAFEAVLVELLATDGSQKNLKTRLRRLYAKAYLTTSTAMANDPESTPSATLTMHKADRVSRTADLRARIVGFTMENHNLPSHGLIDRANTILMKGVVKYMQWLHCTSRTQENKHEPELRGLRLSPDGLLMQDVVKDQTTNLNGEMLWDFALRRRNLACDIGGLMPFENGNSWQEILKDCLLKVPPASCSRISWAQIQDADEALWDFVAEKCEKGTKTMPGEEQTNFQKFWLEGMKHTDVLQHLHFHKGGGSSPQGSSSSSAGGADNTKLSKLRSQLAHAQTEVQGLKRKLNAPAPRDTPGNKGLKGKKGQKGQKGDKGKGKGAKGGPADGIPRSKQDCMAMQMVLNGDRCCWDFHLPAGCSAVRPGEWCARGWHLCHRCGKAHSLQVPCP